MEKGDHCENCCIHHCFKLNIPTVSYKNEETNAIFEVLITVIIKIMVFWKVMPCSLVDIYQYF
jgi:hypothetical protein